MSICRLSDIWINYGHKHWEVAKTFRSRILVPGLSLRDGVRFSVIQEGLRV